MKTALSIALLALAVVNAPSQTNAPTNSPRVILRGIYNDRSKARQEPQPRSTHDVTVAALRQFRAIQNADGSLTEEGFRQLSTAFALIALLRTGENPDSRDFGDTIVKAHAWLLKSEPQTDPERVATAVALSDWISVQYRWHYNADETKRVPVPAAEIQKVRECIEGISPTCGEIWKDFLAFARLPIELGRQRDAAARHALWGRYLDRKPPDLLSSIDDYLLLYICTNAQYRNGGQRWKTWNDWLKPTMIQLQEADGLFPCATKTDRVAATGLSVMNLTIYYMFAPNFFGYVTPATLQLASDSQPAEDPAEPPG